MKECKGNYILVLQELFLVSKCRLMVSHSHARKKISQEIKNLDQWFKTSLRSNRPSCLLTDLLYHSILVILNCGIFSWSPGTIWFSNFGKLNGLIYIVIPNFSIYTLQDSRLIYSLNQILCPCDFKHYIKHLILQQSNTFKAKYQIFIEKYYLSLASVPKEKISYNDIWFFLMVKLGVIVRFLLCPVYQGFES